MFEDAMRASDLGDRAKVVLPAEVYACYSAGAGQQRALQGQERAWDDPKVRPRVLRDVANVSTSVAVLGTELATPVLVARAAVQGLAHPEGELSTAADTRDAGSLLIVSRRASRRHERIASAAGPWRQQIFPLRDRGISDEVARRAAESGARSLVVTVDVPFLADRPGGPGAHIPHQALAQAFDGSVADDPRLSQAPDLGIADIARLKEAADLPVVVKGVLRSDEAVRCLDAGADAIVVSTHGGRQLDGVVPSAVALPEVVQAVGSRAEVYVDGGIRTGDDVLRALALGARAVLVARPLLWALAVGGSGGVRDLLTRLTDATGHSLAQAGCASPADASADPIYP